MEFGTCQNCGKEDNIDESGLCDECRGEEEGEQMGTCQECGRQDFINEMGLCNICYQERLNENSN